MTKQHKDCNRRIWIRSLDHHEGLLFLNHAWFTDLLALDLLDMGLLLVFLGYTVVVSESKQQAKTKLLDQNGIAQK